jgi:Ni,Fe-hydrogenase I large subunit
VLYPKRPIREADIDLAGERKPFKGARSDAMPGPYEAALMDRHSLYDPKQPLEIQRTIHSFDPRIACAVRVVNSKGEELMQLRVK